MVARPIVERPRPEEPVVAGRRGSGGNLPRTEKDGRAALRAAWQRLHGKEAPAALTADFLRRDIAYRVQADRHGGLGTKLQKRLAALAEGVSNGTPRSTGAPIQIKPGSTLLREWRGRTYTVLALETGFEMTGQRFATLSEIARHVTGAHWSGPRFFGLKRVTRSGAPDA
jgi:hypothetical protein